MQYEKRSFEVDPMQCECGGKLRVVSFITTAQQNVIDRILDQIGEDPELPWSTGPPKWYALQLAQQHVEANPHVDVLQWVRYRRCELRPGRGMVVR